MYKPFLILYTFDNMQTFEIFERHWQGLLILSFFFLAPAEQSARD